MDLSQWASVAAIAAVGIALFGYLLTMNKSLEDKIDKSEAGLGQHIDKVDAKVDKAREEAKADNVTTRTELGDRIDTVDAKVDKAREEAKADNAQTRSEVKSDLAEVRADFRFLSERMINFLAHPPEPRPQTHGE